MEDFSQYLEALKGLRTRTVVLTLNGFEAWVLLAHLQLALRHPDNTGQSRDVAMKIAKAVEAVVTDRPELAELAAAGWDGKQ